MLGQNGRNLMDAHKALNFVRRHGIVLESAHGAVPTFADNAAGERVCGSWWRHPKSHLIFAPDACPPQFA